MLRINDLCRIYWLRVWIGAKICKHKKITENSWQTKWLNHLVKKIFFQMSEKNYILELSEGRCDDPKARIFKAALEEFGLRSLAGQNAGNRRQGECQPCGDKLLFRRKKWTIYGARPPNTRLHKIYERAVLQQVCRCSEIGGSVWGAGAYARFFAHKTLL